MDAEREDKLKSQIGSHLFAIKTHATYVAEIMATMRADTEAAGGKWPVHLDFTKGDDWIALMGVSDDIMSPSEQFDDFLEKMKELREAPDAEEA